MGKLPQYAKAAVALIAAVCVWAGTYFPDAAVAQWAGIVLALLGAGVTAAIPNRRTVAQVLTDGRKALVREGSHSLTINAPGHAGSQ